ncbi:MAG TPA: HAMP domain-containing sensor histidine kinase [Bacteroidales bacterium]|nr:HAMP domain-containing sensor histidine kinase [Bacteroidales bacterium]
MKVLKEANLTKRMTFVIVISIFICELFIMMIMEQLETSMTWLKLIIDPILLTMMLFPAVYIWGIRPLGVQIVERKKAEAEIKNKNEQLLKSLAEKSRFFSIIAHDLKSPFNGFLGLTQTMSERLPHLSNEELKQITTVLENSATNLYGLLNNLLQWASVEQGLIPFNPEDIKLLSMTEESIVTILEPAKNKELELTINIPKDLNVYTDKNMLQTVLRNFVSNAVKFTPKKGKINVSAIALDNRFVEVTVEDTGIGMSAEMVENLFRPDFQMNRVGTEGEPSTGLGLLLCKEFIEKQHGKIWVESEVGKGSTFHFTLTRSIEY